MSVSGKMHRKVRAKKLYIMPDAHILKLEITKITSVTEYKAHNFDIHNNQID